MTEGEPAGDESRTDDGAATAGEGPAAEGRHAPSPRRPGEPEAIFVVGLSRSGTTLLRLVLGRHSRIAIADENHYLGHLLPGQGVRRQVRKAGDLREDANVRMLVDRLYDPAFLAGTRLRETSPFWRWLARRVGRRRLEKRLLAGERSERGVFTAVLQIYAARRRKVIFGEKTPAHLRFAGTLLEWYPTARVVHIVRDPRAVYVSELKRRRVSQASLPYRWLLKAPPLLRAFVLLEVTWAWADAVARDRSLARRYPAAYIRIRFEDLVRNPGPVVTRLCARLGVDMEPAMLEQKVVSRGTRLGDAGFDAEAADRWRRSITPRDLCWIQRLLGRRLGELGYEPV